MSRLVCVLTFGSFVWVGCGGDSNGEDGRDGGPPETVEDALDRLSVEREITPRLGPDGQALPDQHAPLGPRADLRRFVEIGVVGFWPDLGNNDETLSLLRLEPGSGPSLTPTAIDLRDDTEAPWADGIRGTAAADVDGDGLDEFVVATWEPPFVQVRVIDDEEAGLATSEPRVVADVEPTRITVEPVDMDGDGDDDLAIGLVFEGSAQVRFVETEGTALTPSTIIDVVPRLADTELDLRLSAGRVDGDLGEELGLVLNELGSQDAAASYVLLDDASADHAELSSGFVRNPEGDQIYTAVAADLSLGDIDGDGVDEIVFGGLTNVSFGTSTEEWGVMAYALDDAFTGYAAFPVRFFEQGFQGLSESGQSLRLETLFVDTLDIDGDQVDEIHVQQTVYDDFAGQAPWTVIDEIDTEDLIWEFGSADFTFETAAMAVGDVTRDGRDDIVFVSEASRGIAVWGIDATEPDRLQSLATVPGFGTGDPQLALPDLDGDSIQVTYEGGSYQLVFTEPVVIAALAAPPCNPDWGQDPGACTTAFGEATTSSVTEED
ncbi:MAG: hypothetical protein AAF211_22215, partial [Myxococcota bacterium]